MSLSAPFPWFGGKRKVAAEVWARFGAVDNYVEPFFGSGAVLLNRPSPYRGNETICDADGYVANFWRAVKGHECLHLTGVVRFGEMVWTCDEHFEELKQYLIEADYPARRDN